MKLIQLSAIVPSMYTNAMETQLRYAGKTEDVRAVVGKSAFVAIVLFLAYALVISILLQFEISLTVILVNVGLAILLPLLSLFGFYLYYYFIADKRSESALADLPNVLNLMAANIRSGMTPFHAVKSAGISEFGVLGDEIRKATSRSLGSKQFTVYLVEMSRSFKNPALERSMRLFASSIKAGGKLTLMLEQLSADLTERRALKNELMTHMKTNVVFIMFIVILGTPTLLAISIYFLDTITEIQGDNAGSIGEGGGFGGTTGAITGELTITSDFLVVVSWFMLGLTGLFACFFLGAVKDGDVKKGLSLAPVLIVASYVLFIIVRWLINYLLV